MRLIFRVIWIVALGLVLATLALTWLQVRKDRNALRRDLDRRASAAAETLASVLEPVIEKPSQVVKVVNRYSHTQKLLGVAVYDTKGKLLASTPDFQTRFPLEPQILSNAIEGRKGQGAFVRQGKNSFHIYGLPLSDSSGVDGGIAIVQDASYIGDSYRRAWREAAVRLAVQLAVVSLIALLMMQRSFIHPLSRTAQWLKAVRTGRTPPEGIASTDELFQPFAHEVTTLAKSLNMARAAVEQEARLRYDSESIWTPERLAIHVKQKLGGSQLFVVANREPYLHRFKGREIETIVPASGLVTALEPILNACDGTWIAHGSGDADTKTVDSDDRLRVPPDSPRYSLRRVWLSKEEEQGYYYGFSNEGLWPLCHIAHTRPIFREADWRQYKNVNQKFAKAVLQEIAGVEEPVVLVQDYHFALLPRLIKQKRPDARVAIFWHIPWPNPEAFGICPWQAELLDGLLGADLIGFHIHAHCHNFLGTVDRALECRIDWPGSTATRSGHRTEVKPFPISVEPAHRKETSETQKDYLVTQPQLLRELGIEAMYLGVGVDRVDYTKGIPERFAGIERFLEKYPEYQGKLTFVQIGAPSRTHIRRYQDLINEVERESERINWKFQKGGWKPILFLHRHHTHEEIDRFYKAADFCLVTSLHDGMNLVAKEFLAAREDDAGMLILSRFAGAAYELHDALIINPYDTDEMADAIRTSLEMMRDERQRRMQRMRRIVNEQNIYRWAGSLIGELSDLHIDGSFPHEAKDPRPLAADVATAAKGRTA